MPFTQGHALIVGVGKYTDLGLDKNGALEITARDATNFAEVLKDDRAAAYPPNQVQLLTKTDATRAKILEALQQLAKKTAETSTVIIFLCGHGELDKTTKNYLFLPHDTARSGSGFDPNTVISDDELINAIQNIKRRKMLLIFNTCHSGSLASLSDDEPVGNPPSDEALDKILNTGEGLYLVSACRPNQKSWFMPNDTNTFFMQYVLEGLRGQGGISNKKGYIGLFELYGHVYDAVSVKIKKLGQIQDPVITVKSGVGAFPVALYKGGEGLANLSDDELDQKPRITNPDPNPSAFRGVSYNIQAGRDVNQVGRDQTNVSGNANSGSGTQWNIGNIQGGFNQGNTYNQQTYNQQDQRGANVNSRDQRGSNINTGDQSGANVNYGQQSGFTYNQQDQRGSTFNTTNTGGGDYVDTGGGAFFKGSSVNISGGNAQFGANSTINQTNNYGAGNTGSQATLEQLFSQLNQQVQGISDPKIKRNAERALEDISELKTTNAQTDAIDFDFVGSSFKKANVQSIAIQILRHPNMQGKYTSLADEWSRM
jgi:hypothetical protein